MAEILYAKDLRVRSDEELKQFLTDKSDELMRLRFQHATGQLENVGRVKEVKKEIARARTIATERSRASAE
jgi:large subunit ribosomal protein L29